jgi:phosphopantothenate-cysteine ligase
VHVCAPQLETDSTLLIPKARAALERYGHQVVIGNDLHRRKFQVVFVSRKHGGKGDDAFEESWLNIEQNSSEISRNGPEIEKDIVAELGRRHSLWMARTSSKY